MSGEFESGVSALEKVSHTSAATSAASGAGVLMGLDWAAIGVIGGLVVSVLTFIANLAFRYADKRRRDELLKAQIEAIRNGRSIHGTKTD